MDRLDFRRSLVSGLPSPRTAFGEERGLISRAAADNRAYRMDRYRSERSLSIPLAKLVSRSFKMKDIGSLLLVLRLNDDFDGDINEIVLAASFIVILKPV